MPDHLRDAIDLADATRFSTAELKQLVYQLLAETAGVDAVATATLEVALARINYACRDLERAGDELRELAV